MTYTSKTILAARARNLAEWRASGESDSRELTDGRCHYRYLLRDGRETRQDVGPDGQITTERTIGRR
jgi:hypothetical protein